ncbi:polysaccharide pyruvyl transferase family protein [Pedobacter psychroterrae]|uniref:Polysaccharide pyruvyl transferase family protein n=2 Tax=Pedobacter psychroterrae TaxID=2530453 RepID=A0A4R0NPH2_9SPHI|nr:polysaccharide pyruvyl transferase family protein [Pedobacter psychroterrae]
MFLTSTQIKHLLRNLNQKMIKTPFGIVGGYHGYNLGDMALGASIIEVLSAQGKPSGLQTIYNLEKWPTTQFAIVGGGAVGYNDSLGKVAARYKDHYGKVALLGVDFMEDTYAEDCLELIRGAAFVSGRSKSQAEKLMKSTGRAEIFHHPDIAFSLFSGVQPTKRNQTAKKKLLINVLPLYGSVKNGKLQPLEKYKSERPGLFDNFHQMHVSYKQGLRRLVKNAVAEGYSVETIPFTLQDEAYGHILLDDLPVKHHPYHSNVLKMYKTISSADWVVSTRLHATIFALKAGIKVTPIAYATKNELMLEELGVERSSFLTTQDLANGKNVIPPPIVYNKEVLKAWGATSREAIEKAIESVMK